MKDYIQQQEQLVLLKIYVQPGAKVEKTTGLYGDPPRVKIQIKSPPVDGKANKAIICFVAKSFGINKSEVEIIRGETSRSKDVLLKIDFSLAQEILEKLLKQ